MELRQLHTLRVVAEAGSFTKAAAELRLSQSAVSRQIQDLELEIDEPLFWRVGRTIRITPAGATLVALSRRVSDDISQTRARLGDRRQNLTGTIRLVGGMTVCVYVYPQLIKAFQSAHPGVDVKVTPGAMPRILRKLRNGTADLGLLTLPIDDPQLVSEPLLREELVLVMSPVHALARRARVQAHDLAALDFILFETGSNTRRVIDQFFTRTQISPRVVTETDNVEVIKALVSNGTGVAIVPLQAISREVRAGQLRATRVAGHALIRETGWVHLRSKKLPRAVEEMKRALLGRSGRHAAAHDLTLGL